MPHALILTNKSNMTRQVRWNPPHKGYNKVNLDSYSFDILGNAGFGGLLKNDI